MSTPTYDPYRLPAHRPAGSLRPGARTRSGRGDLHGRGDDRDRRRRGASSELVLNANRARCARGDRQRRRGDVPPRARHRAPVRRARRTPAPGPGHRVPDLQRARSTTSCAASTAARTATTTAPSTSSPPRRCSRPTAGGVSRAGTNPTSRRCSGSPWSSTTTCSAISNGPEISRTVHHSDGGRKFAVSFADTMKMSTYLVAFVVGPLEATRGHRRRRGADAPRARAGQGAAERVRARGRRGVAALVHRLLRHPVPRPRRST